VPPGIAGQAAEQSSLVRCRRSQTGADKVDHFQQAANDLNETARNGYYIPADVCVLGYVHAVAAAMVADAQADQVVQAPAWLPGTTGHTDPPGLGPAQTPMRVWTMTGMVSFGG
jgi:hypothetical protein